MKPLLHPSPADMSVEGVLYALSDPVRVRIYAEIASAGCPKNCASFLEQENRTLPKSTLSQHFRVLREAGLIRSEKVGVEMRNTARCDEIPPALGQMIKGIVEAYATQAKKKSKKR